MSKEPVIDKKPIHDWTREERIEVVKRIFNTVTPHYDKLNRIMSARQDVKWRRFTASRLSSEHKKVLDVATGTGDLAIDIISKWADTEVIGVDFVEDDATVIYLVLISISLPFAFATVSFTVYVPGV